MTPPIADVLSWRPSWKRLARVGRLPAGHAPVSCRPDDPREACTIYVLNWNEAAHCFPGLFPGRHTQFRSSVSGVGFELLIDGQVYLVRLVRFF